MSVVTEIRVTLPKITLAAKQWNRGAAKKAVAVHGWLDNASSFDHLASLIEDTEIIALDLPGHGYSDHRPSGTNYHFTEYVEDVIAAIEALGWDQLTLIGHSLGAAINSFVAAVIPERIERLVLIEGIGPFTKSPIDAPDHFREAIRQKKHRHPDRIPLYRSLEEMVTIRQAAGNISEGAVRTLLQRNVRVVQNCLSWTSDSRLTQRTLLYIDEAQIQAFLAAIKAPTLLILADQGIVRPSVPLEERIEKIDNIVVKNLPGGHHLHLDAPKPVADEISTFFQTIHSHPETIE